jgi:hypothetical protein
METSLIPEATVLNVRRTEIMPLAACKTWELNIEISLEEKFPSIRLKSALVGVQAKRF